MTQKILTASVECPCGKIVFVYWGSFLGCGKKCPRCGKVLDKSNVKAITRHF